jgi:hypothetical protein
VVGGAQLRDGRLRIQLLLQQVAINSEAGHGVGQRPQVRSNELLNLSGWAIRLLAQRRNGLAKQGLRLGIVSR